MFKAELDLMRILINGARIIDPASGMDQQADIFIDDGKIVAIGDMPREFVAEQMIDACGASSSRRSHR